MLKILNIKNSYINHGKSNLVDNLINPALKESILYRRTTAYFSSTIFDMLYQSLHIFSSNGGKIQLIVSPNLYEDDIDAITKGYENREQRIEKKFINDFKKEIAMFDEKRLDFLYELVVNGVLDIKVAVMKNNTGIYHDKLGIITDENNNSIVFYGSANATFKGYSQNYEKIRVVKSWDTAEKNLVDEEILEFENLWNNKNQYVDVYQFTESIKKSIVLTIEKNKQDYALALSDSGPIKLYDYQQKAISNWVDNGYNGFYVMATGTGKTWTAIYSAKQLYECHPCLIVIAAPYKHLIKQWEEDVVKVFPDAKIILVSSENPQWENEIANNIIIQQYKPSHQIIIITTIPSFNLDRFEKILDKSKQEKLLIVDEAHRFNKRTQKTKDRFNYMLGLSATPVNWKNIEEGKELVEYFGGQVYTLTIDKALEKGFLVQYYYYPLFVHATKNEEVAFTNLTRQIMGCFSPNGQVIDKERLMKLTRARLRVIAMAEEKQLNIGQLLDAVKDKDYFIVYCGDGKVDDDEDGSIKHYDFVKKHLDEANIRTSQFTATESMAKRMELIDMFNNNEISSLVAIRCLDEGINIPSIRSALILASKDDYREFVQRRGRILRKYPGKKFANIYDVIVLPSADMSNFAKIELRRFYEYARLAINKEEMLLKLNDLLSFYNLSLEEDIILYTETEMEDFLDE